MQARPTGGVPPARLDPAAHRRRARRTGGPGDRRGRAARRRRDGAVHRPLPQGGDRDRSTTPSCARSRSGCATCASWRSGGRRSSSRSGRRASSTTRCEAQIMAADSKARLEDIYLPYKPKRRTKAQIAREAGLEPLADALLADPTPRPAAAAAGLRRRRARAWPTPPPRWTGARAILVERFAEDADLIGALRETDVDARAGWRRRSATGKEEAGAKFADYFDFAEPYHQAALAPHPGHVPGREGGGPRPDDGAGPAPGRPPPAPAGPTEYEREIAVRFGVADRGRPADKWLRRHGALGLAHPDPHPPRHRPADAAVAGGRGRGGTGVRGQPARPAARRAGRHPRHDGPGPGLPHRREGGRGRRHRQGGRHRHDLPARAGAAVARVAGHAGPPGRARTRSS